MEQKALTEFHDYIPTMKMRLYVGCLLSVEVKGNKEEATRRTGVSKQLFFYHLKSAKDKDQFTAWYIDQCRKFIVSFRDRISVALIDKAASGDVSAIRLCFELMGDIKSGGVNIQANALPGSRQPLIIIAPGAEQPQPIETERIEEKK